MVNNCFRAALTSLVFVIASSVSYAQKADVVSQYLGYINSEIQSFQSAGSPPSLRHMVEESIQANYDKINPSGYFSKGLGAQQGHYLRYYWGVKDSSQGGQPGAVYLGDIPTSVLVKALAEMKRTGAKTYPVPYPMHRAYGYIPTARELNSVPTAPASSPYIPTNAERRSALSAPVAPPVATVRVWVNTKTGVYHLPGSRWYGITSSGRYMSEPDALAAGYRRSERG